MRHPASGSLRRRLLQAGALAVLSPWTRAADLMTTPARVSAKAAGSLMLSVCATRRRIVAVGERGIVLVSSDDGRSWVQGHSPTSVTLTGTYFVDDDAGWAVGHSGVVLRTTDGGKTWASRFDGRQANALLLESASRRVAELEAARAPAQQIAQAKDALADVKAGERFGPARPLLDLWFASADTGFVVGSYGQIFETRDGGANWHTIGDRLNNPEALHLNAITGTASGRLMVVGEAGRVWLSADGREWAGADTGYKGQLYGGLFVRDEDDKEVLIVFGFAGKVFRSTDAGRSWSEINTGRRKTIVAGKSRGNAIALVDVEGGVLESLDGGRTCRLAGGPLPLQVRGAAVTASGKLVLAGFGGVHLLPDRRG